MSARALRQPLWWPNAAGRRREPPKLQAVSPRLEVPAAPPFQPLALWQKLAPLAVIFFCATFNHTLLVNLKDAIMVTSGGAETLPFLASCVVLPASLAFFVLYGRILDLHLPRSSSFALTVAPLVAVYAGFAAFLYPAADMLHPHGLVARFAPLLPIGLHGLLKVVENWTYSLFFCVAELWGAVVISVLFWTLANEVCTVGEAKTIYPLMGIAANVALVAAGNFMKAVNLALPNSELSCLRVLVATVLALTAVIFGAEVFVERRIAVDSHIDPGAGMKKKKKATLSDALAVLRSSPMIFALSLMVISYGVGHRLFEFAWKGQLRMLYPSAMAYQGVLADVSIATGYVTIALMVSGRFIFQYLGWATAAFITPMVLMLFGGAFFAFSLSGSPATASLAVLAGAVTQVCARSSKFSLFDPAKEMAYIQMSRAEKRQGKAAVDLIGSQVGKSGASWVTQALLLALGSISAAMPVIAAIFGGVVTSFFFAVNGLRKEMVAHDKRRQDSESAAAAATAIAAEADAAGAQPAGGEGGNVYRLAPSHVPEVTATANGHSVPGVVNENGGVKLGGPAARPNVSAACCRRQARRRLLW
ncbi:g4776 [Coccomyxa elongata]